MNKEYSMLSKLLQEGKVTHIANIPIKEERYINTYRGFISDIVKLYDELRILRTASMTQSLLSTKHMTPLKDKDGVIVDTVSGLKKEANKINSIINTIDILSETAKQYKFTIPNFGYNKHFIKQINKGEYYGR
jgi:hypothetical protein